MQKKPLSRYWLLVGVGALAIAGLYALLLVAARTPQLKSLPVMSRLFHEALVVHVDLSVLVWFLSIACLLWGRITSHERCWLPYIEESALICMALGTLAIALSPLDSASSAMMSNYIPVIYSPVFFFGLSLVACAVTLMVAKLLFSLPLAAKEMGFALTGAAVITLVSLVAFAWSYRQMPGVIDGQQYYDMLFWGGGHILQFTHVQVAMVCWLMLYHSLSPPLNGSGKIKCLFAIGVISAFAGLAPYLLFDITSMQHRDFFTYLMIFANGIAPTLLALWMLPGLWRQRQKQALWSTLFMSLALFLYGGVLGAMITGQNVVIPAHYHGSIVGVTLAFMGLAYFLLPEFGYRPVAGWKMAFWQPVVYGVGQVMHITGLAYSGGYGVLRKTPAGEMVDIALPVKVALGFMGLGGLIAIIGGLMFVVVVWRSCARPAG